MNATNQTNQTNATNQLAIHTTAPELKIGEIMLTADKRSAKGASESEKLADCERIRRAVLPAGFWGGYEVTINSQSSIALTDILTAKLRELASAKLKEYLGENPLAREIDASGYTIAAVLAWNAESAASRGSMTIDGDDVADWFKVSITKAKLETAYTGAKGAALVAKLQASFIRSVKPAHGIATSADGLKLLSLIHPDDTNHATVVELIGRIDGIVKRLTAKEQSEGTIEELTAAW